MVLVTVGALTALVRKSLLMVNGDLNRVRCLPRVLAAAKINAARRGCAGTIAGSRPSFPAQARVSTRQTGEGDADCIGTGGGIVGRLGVDLPRSILTLYLNGKPWLDKTLTLSASPPAYPPAPASPVIDQPAYPHYHQDLSDNRCREAAEGRARPKLRIREDALPV